MCVLWLEASGKGGGRGKKEGKKKNIRGGRGWGEGVPLLNLRLTFPSPLPCSYIWVCLFDFVGVC